MKKIVLLTSFVVLSIFLYVGCKKYDEKFMPKSELNNSEPPVVLGNIKGKIILPTSSTLNVNSFKVETPVATSTVTDSTFDVQAYVSEFNSLLVVDNSSKVILMGYDYPEQSDKSISITTTSLALVMNTPAVLSLSKVGKLALIDRIKTDANFQELKNEVEANVLLNKDLFDTTNTVLFQKIEVLLTSASNKKGRSISDAVLFQQLEPNNNFKFYNDGTRVISSVVGVYKDNQRIKEIVVEGINFMPTSIQDITSLDFAAVSSPPAPIYYSLTGNGQYEFKARTGRPDSYENSIEFENAFLLNIQKMSLGLLKPFLPKLKSNSLSCFVKPSKIIYDLYKIKNYDITALTFEVVQQMLSNAEEIEQCINGNTNLFNSSYFPSMQKYFKRLELLFLPASAFNQTLFGIQWATIKPSLDKCFIKFNDTIVPCYIPVSAKFNGVESYGATTYGIINDWATNEFYIEIMMNGFGQLRLRFPDAVGIHTNKTMQLDAFQIGNYNSPSNTIEVISADTFYIKGRFNGILVGPDTLIVSEGIFNIQRRS